MWWKTTLVVVAVVALGAALWVRLAPADITRWHVDPLLVDDPERPNFARIDAGAVTAPDADALALSIDAVMRGMPRTRLLAGSVAEGWMTYETRSRLMGYPDYTSIRVLPHDAGATFAAFARSRFGGSDLGVNRARLATLRAGLQR